MIYNKFIMTQEEKELLLKDLCARIPYNTKLKAFDVPDIDFYLYSISSTDIVAKTAKGGVICMSIEGFKPYLFPMSSMTEEQKEEYKQFLEDIDGYAYSIDCVPQIDWLNKNHFDYRGLIEKGLAINATNLNIY